MKIQKADVIVPVATKDCRSARLIPTPPNDPTPATNPIAMPEKSC